MRTAPPLRMTLNQPTEQEEQLALFQRMMLLEPRYPALAFIFHIGNGAFLGANRQRYGRLLLNLGVRPGVPDICCPIARQGFHGLWIELKRLRYSPSDVEPAQRRWHDELRSHGHKVEVCAGWVDAWNTLADYLGIDEERVK